MQNTHSFTAGAPIEKGRFVKLSGGNVIHCAATTDVPLGVADDDAASGDPVTIILEGLCDVAVASALTVGTAVKSDASGLAIAHSSTDPKSGLALETGVAAGTDLNGNTAYSFARILLYGNKDN
jgi:hypothetical protein